MISENVEITDDHLTRFISVKEQKKRRFVITILTLTVLFVVILSAILTGDSGPRPSAASDTSQLSDEELLSLLSKPGITKLSEAEAGRALKAARSAPSSNSALVNKIQRTIDENKRSETMKDYSKTFTLVAIVLVAGLLSLFLVIPYNQISFRDEAVDESWAQVQAVMQRRHDLLPKLAEVVRSYAKHESSTLEEIAKLRSSASKGILSVEESEKLDTAYNREREQLFVVIERYPDLKANQNFLALQDQLEGTENRIGTERIRYNDAVKSYNRMLRAFPYNLVGGWFSFAPRPYFEAAAEAEESPNLGL